MRRGFLTCMEDREIRLYRLVVKLLREGSGFLRNFSDETLHPVAAAVRHLNGEAHLLKGFLRFSELGGILGSEIEPKNRVLPKTRNFSFMTALTTRRCFTPPARPSSARWQTFRWRRRTRRRPPTGCFGSGFTIPWLFGSGKIRNCE